jgi:hypothetical protein
MDRGREILLLGTLALNRQCLRRTSPAVDLSWSDVYDGGEADRPWIGIASTTLSWITCPLACLSMGCR